MIDGESRLAYVSVMGAGRVAVTDLTGGSAQVFIRTGERPRSIALSEDGLSLYVVHYESGGMIKVATAGMRVVQRIAAGSGPVGIAYEPNSARIWVADYRGVLWVFDDRIPD